MIYPWQQTQWQQVQQAMQRRLHHAWLLAGPKGLGKLAFAREMAHLRLCDQSEQQPCGQCRGCQLFAAGNHPDYFECQPEEGSRSIKVDQIRVLITQLSQTAQRGQGQVVVIHPAESMNTAAANALLKTLEEPSGEVLLLLVAHENLTIPATIISRCQRLSFTVSDEPQAQAWLAEQVEEQHQLALAWRLSAGAPLLAQAYLDSDQLGWRDQVLDHLGLIHQSRHDPIAAVTQWTKWDMAVVLHLIASVVNDLIALQLGVDVAHCTHQDQPAKLKFLAKHLPLAALLAFQQQLVERQRLWRTAQSINPQLLLEYVLLKWLEVGQSC